MSSVPKYLFNHTLESDKSVIEKDHKDCGNKISNFLSLYKIVNQFKNAIESASTVTFFFIVPETVNLKHFLKLEDNLKILLKVQTINLIAPVMGTNTVAVEIPKEDRETIYLGDFLNALDKEKSILPVAIGNDINNNPMVFDLTKAPHMLVAGATGSGKSVVVNNMICSLMYNFSASEVQFLMIDPKMVELTIYNDAPHLIHPVVCKVDESIEVLKYAVREMERRYELMRGKNIRNIVSYNKVSETKMPYLVIVIDEYADLMLQAKKSVEELLARLSAMARAVGIHLILATQRPSADIVTGVIKANFPTRIACSVASAVDSRVVLGTNGAENLLGKGDLLFQTPSMQQTVRLQSPFTSEEEVANIVSYLEKNVVASAMIDISEETVEVKKEKKEDPAFTETQFAYASKIMEEYKQFSSLFLQSEMRISLKTAKAILAAYAKVA